MVIAVDCPEGGRTPRSDWGGLCHRSRKVTPILGRQEWEKWGFPAGVGQGIFPKQHQSSSWREGLVRREGRKEGAEANGSEEGVDLGRGGQEGPVFPLLLFPGRAERLGHQGPQAPSPDGWPRCVLTANGGARGGTCGKRGGSQQSKEGVAGLGTGNQGGQGTSPCRDWV